MQTMVFSITGLLALGMILFTGWWFFQKNQYLPYKNNKKKFSIRYPAGWEAVETQKGVDVIFKTPTEGTWDNFRENVNLIVQDISQKPMTLEAYSSLAIDQMQAIFGENLLIQAAEEVSLAGRPGFKFEYIGKGPDGELHFRHYWTLVDSNAYQITYTAMDNSFDQYIDQVEHMIKTFRIQ